MEAVAKQLCLEIDGMAPVARVSGHWQDGLVGDVHNFAGPRLVQEGAARQRDQDER